MISVVVISYGRNPCEYIKMHIDSIKRKQSGLINEIIVVHNRENEAYEKEELLGNVKILHIGRPIVGEKKFINRAIATYEGIKYATNNYLLLTDPDLIYAKKHFDKLYVELYEKYDLNLIGISHFLKCPYGPTFPCGINMLVKKDTLPNENWMKGKLIAAQEEAPGNILSEGRIHERALEYPYPFVNVWDQGANVYLWNKDLNGKYITFLHRDGTNYKVNKVFANFDLDKEQFKDEILLSHARHSFGGSEAKELMKQWMKKYEVGKKIF